MAKNAGKQTSRAPFAAHAATLPRHRRTGLWLVLAVLAALLIAGGAGAYTFYKQAMQVKDHEMAAVDLVKTVSSLDQLKDPDALANIVPQMQEHTSAAKEISQGWMWNLAGMVPVVGDDIRAVQGMASVVDDLAQTALPKLSDTAHALLTAQLSDNGAVNLTPIADASEGLTEANTLIQEQLEDLQNLPTPHIGMVKDAYTQGVSQFQDIAELLDQATNMVQILPQFLGQDGTRTYLIIANTPAETRSGGGLIGSLGTMTAENGKITIGDFHSNKEFQGLGSSATASEQAVFSWPLKFSFDIRDQMAKPDFADVAASVVDIWNRSPYACEIDGVMSIDPVFIQELVKLNGDITLDNGMVVTGDNAAEFLLNTIYKEVAIDAQDQYFQIVAFETMDKMFSGLDFNKLMAMAKTMIPMAQQRHLYMYSFHEDEAQNFQNAGLAKGLPSSEENPEVGIYMNQQNASKLDWYVQRQTQVTRTACNTDGSQTYRISFTMTNTVPWSDVYNYSWYLVGGNNNTGSAGQAVERMLFYAPAGGSLSNFSVSSNMAGAPEQTTMDDATVWTSVAYMGPGESVTYEFDVTTSPKAVSDLTVDQTPLGWTDTGVTVDTSACAIQ